MSSPTRLSHLTHRSARPLLALLLSSLGLVAWAQPGPGHGPGLGPGGLPGRAAQEAGPEHGQRVQAWQARRMEELKGRLQLTAAQESAWTRYTEALRATPVHQAAHAAQWQELMQLPTPERIDRMKALRAQHQAEMASDMDRRGEATKAFYAVLDDEQKKTFDAETARLMHGGGRTHAPGRGPGQGPREGGGTSR